MGESKRKELLECLRNQYDIRPGNGPDIEDLTEEGLEKLLELMKSQTQVPVGIAVFRGSTKKKQSIKHRDGGSRKGK